MSQAYDLLRQALLNRQSCFAVYDGYDRYFCPHVLGFTDGHEQALCWQYAGQSSRPLPPQGQWKCFEVSKLTQLRLINEAWHPGEPGRTGKPQSCVKRVEEEIQL